ncbi:MAG: hypothetical protein K8R54_10000 [Bacteroidales bacterium]|nr:hypothetical protein [Bacteroidales bacterium]
MFRNFIVILILIFSFSDSFSQFDDNNTIFKCAQIFGDSITFLNDFSLNLPKRKISEDPNGKEWDVYLMKGTEYRFALCCSDGINDIIMRLFNEEFTEESPIGSTGSERKTNPYFDFICRKSGIYKVSVRFKKENVIGVQLTATGLLGFVRKINL